MKFNFFNGLALAALCSLAFISCNNSGNNRQQAASPAASAQTQPAQAQALPQVITDFINQYFPGATVTGVEPDNEFGGTEYDVYLNDGTELDFDKSHQWEEVDCKDKAVPAAFVPTNMANYVKTACQGQPIVKISKKSYSGYEVKLANGQELHFDASGNFTGYDND